MNPEQQRIAIAEACGWRQTHDKTGWVMPDGYEKCDCPDYLNDLNAMHEAEKTLDDGVLWKGYLNRLWDVVCPHLQQMAGLNAAVGLLLCHATAAQRAEAFLKTIGKWEDGN